MTTDNAGMMSVLDMNDPGTPASARGLDDTYEGGIDVDDHTHDTPPARKPNRRREITQRQKWLMFERFGVKADSQEHEVECFYCGDVGRAIVVPPGEPRKVWCDWPHYGYEMRCENKWWVRSSFDVDHVRPVSLGGKHEVWNFVPACITCNASKSNRTLGAWFDVLADKRRSKHPRRLVILERFGALS